MSEQVSAMAFKWTETGELRRNKKMTATQIVVDIMFAMCLITFISSFVHSFAARFGEKALFWSDIILCIILLIVFILVQGN